ncbi:hypothetical protein FS749_003277 [Ceratobasidium sp. UAMH 11750]|nr:hypothetical protein FS749_003277 [Ceratobasidium sp. UAMH 11750]
MPYFVSLLESFIKDGKHSSENKLEDIPMAISVVGSVLWIKRSQKANYFARGFTQYLYTSGVQAATIGVLNRCGIAVSYGTLLESLETLNQSCIHRFRKVAARCRSFFMWDNVNFGSSVVEQRIKNSGSFESGTASTLVELHPPPGCEPEAIDEALDLDKYLNSIQNAPDLKLADVMITPEDEKQLRDEFAFQTINVLVEHGGERFKQYKKHNNLFRPLIRPLLPLRTTKAYPLPTLHLEQASANGNATVTEELRRITEIDKSELFKRRLGLATGDLLTVLRLLSLRDVRTLYMRTPVHIKDNYESLSYLVPFCGLFHTRIAAVAAIFNTHFGKPNTRPKDAPVSLWRHNELLKRKNIPIQQSLKYRTAQDLTFHSLYARLLDVVRITSGCESLRQFGEELSKVPEEQAWNRLKDTTLAAVTRFTTPQVAGTDDVLRNSILFIRDALLFRCFVASVKCGNMAMIELILKVWAVAFRGAGRSQYASELLRFRHNLCHAWPKPLRYVTQIPGGACTTILTSIYNLIISDLILSNMLVNMTGKKDSWKETDLLQEHINYWIKVVYKARGPNASWAWLENISSCITTLRRLADEMNASFGPPNSNYHTTPSIQTDLDALLKHLVEEQIHTQDLTRRFSNQSLRVKDVLVLGFQSLAGPNSPITKFNRTRFGARGSHSLTNARAADDAELAPDDTQAQDVEIEDDDLFDVVIDDGDDVEAGAPFDIA